MPNPDDVNAMNVHPDIPGPAQVHYERQLPVSALWTGSEWVDAATRAPVAVGAIGWTELGPPLYGPGATPLRRS